MTAPAKTGFTLVELMVVVLSASILALTVGSMVVVICKTWSRTAAMTELERDAAVAFHAFDIAVRGAARTNLVTGPNVLQVVTGGKTKSFTRVDNSLLFNPNGAAGGLTLINGRLDDRAGVDGFVSTYAASPSSHINVTLNLLDPASGAVMRFSNLCFRLRN